MVQSQDNSPRRVSFFGAAPDTGNLGVSALCFATLGALLERSPDLRCTVFDYRRGQGPLTPAWPSVYRAGAMLTRRWYRPESYAAIDVALRTGLPLSASAAAIRQSDAVLDISGGDSFTDMYGPWRLQAVAWPKLTALRLGKPLVLLPQTYGPFQTVQARSLAKNIVRGSAMAWARDARSFEILRDLLGSAFDPDRHFSGVDVAFLLPKSPPNESLLPESLRRALSDGRPLVGFNVSGLIFNDPAAARDRYGLRADYRDLVIRFLRWLLARDESDLLLIPHVFAAPETGESDPLAIEAVVRELSSDRVHTLPGGLDASQTKWLISQCGWFCGTRMHATIAGLSSAVCTATISYSDKAKGVFESCGVGEAVVDPRHLDTVAALESLQSVYLDRDMFLARLTQGLPAVMSTAARQMNGIADAVREFRPGLVG